MDTPGPTLRQLVVDMSRNFLERGRPIAVAAAEHREIHPRKGFAAVQPFEEAGSIVGRRAIVGRDADDDGAFSG